MGSYAVLQLFKPPGITSDAATPNFLVDLSNALYQTQWSDLTQGGASSAQFDCRKDYGDIVDIIFGSYVLWGTHGCRTSAAASAGDTSLTVTDLHNPQFSQDSTFPDLNTGDVVMITDGSNTELFKITSVSGSSPTWTLGIDTPGGAILGLPPHLKNNYASGATIVRLLFQGYLSQRVHSTAFDNQFSINTTGFFNRYALFMENANVSGGDAGGWLNSHLSSIAGQPELKDGPGYTGHPTGWPSGTTVFKCTDLASMLVGEKVTLGKDTGNSELLTISAITPGAGSFTTSTASTNNHDSGETVTPEYLKDGPWIPDIVVDAAFIPKGNNGILINLQASDQPLSELIAAVLRQETGANKTLTYACWVDVLRQVHHKAIDSVPPNMGQTTMAADAPAGSSTFQVANIGRIKVDRRVFITGPHGFDSLKVTAVHTGSNSFDTSSNSAFDHPSKDKVVIIYDVTPNFTLSQSDNGSGSGDTINKIQTTDEDGSNLMNAVISSGTVITPNGQIETTLSAAVPAGSGFPGAPLPYIPCSAMPFQAGDTVTIIATDGTNTENVVIVAISGNNFTIDSPGTIYPHAAGRPVVLASGSGAGPRIIMFEADSIAQFGFYEGQLASADITDKIALKAWTKQQLEITAWPLINSAIDLDIASCRMDGRTLLGITGFDDGIPLYLNISQIQYQWLAATFNVTASIQAGILKSTSGYVLKELANRHAIREHQKNPKKHPHNMDGHMHGAEIFPNDDNTFNMNAATVRYGGTVFQVPAVSNQVAPEGVSFWGVDLSDTATPALNPLPSTVFNGRYVYAEEIWEATDDDGVDPTLIASFTGVPLWKVEVRGGVVQGIWPLFATSGVNLANMPSAALPPAPTFASTSESVVALANGLSCDLTVATTFQNIPQDAQTHSIRYYLRTNGTTAWSHKATLKIPGLPIPDAVTLADSRVFHSVVNGTVVDVAASYVTENGEGPLGIIVSGYTVSPVSISAGLPLEFPSPVKFNSDGSWSGFTTAGISSVQQYAFPANGAKVSVKAHFKIGTTGTLLYLIVGDFTNGYAARWAATSGIVGIYSIVAGTVTLIGTVATGATQDNAIHTLRITVTSGATTNLVEVSFDNVQGIATAVGPSYLTLTTGTWPVTIATLADTKWWHFDVLSEAAHYTNLPAQSLAITAKAADGNGSFLAHGVAFQEHIAGMTGAGAVQLDGVPDGVTYGKPKLAGLTSGFATKTGAAGAFNVKGVADSQTLSLDSEIADGSTYARVKAADLTSGHVTKTGPTGAFPIKGVGDAQTLSLDSEVADGSTYARVKSADLTSGHVTKTGPTGAFPIKGVGDSQTLSLDSEVADGSTYARVKGSELASGTVKQVNDGTNTRTAAQIAGALDTNSAIKNSGFAGGVEILTTGALFGFAAGGSSTNGSVVLANGGAIELSADIKMPTAPASEAEIIIGDTSNGYGLRFDTSGTLTVMRYVAGASSVFATINTGLTVDNSWHNFRLAVDLNRWNNTGISVEASWDTIQLMTPTDESGTAPWVTGVTVPITIKAGGTTGFARNVHASTRHLYLASSVPYQIVIAPTPDAHGSYIQPNQVGSSQIQALGVGNGNIALGAVHNPQLGSTAVQGSGSGTTQSNVVVPASIGSADLDLAQLALAIGTIWNNASVYKDTGENYTGFPASTAVATKQQFPIAAAYKIEASGWIELGSTSGVVFLIIGDMTNGYGIRWTAAGSVGVVLWKAGTLVAISTLGTIARDTTSHWLSIAVTPGATPGSSDILQAVFDKLAYGPTTQGAAQVTWGSTAPVTVQMDAGTAAKISQFRAHSTVV